MSIISQALEKNQRPEGGDAFSNERAAQAEVSADRPRAGSGAVIGKRRAPRRAEKTRASDPSAPSPARPAGRSFLALAGCLALIALGVGFFTGGRLGRRPEAVAQSRFEDGVERAKSGAPGRNSEFAEPPAIAPAVSPAPAEISSGRPETVQAQPTPLVVRVEVAVKPERDTAASFVEPREPVVSFPPGRLLETMEYDIPPVPIADLPSADPDVQPPTLAEVKELVQLEGILFSQDEPMAIIRGEIVRDGDEIEGITILKINRSSVLIRYLGEQYELR